MPPKRPKRATKNDKKSSIGKFIKKEQIFEDDIHENNSTVVENFPFTQKRPKIECDEQQKTHRVELPIEYCSKEDPLSDFEDLENRTSNRCTCHGENRQEPGTFEHEDSDDFDSEDDNDDEPRRNRKNHNNSDSDQSLSEGEEVENSNPRVYAGRDGETIWSNQPVQNEIRSKNIVKLQSESSIRNTARPIDAFTRLITTDMIDRIVKYTNIKIGDVKLESKRERDSKETTRSEITALVGALLLISACKGTCHSSMELWATDGTGMLILRANFSSRRYAFLVSALCLDDIRTRSYREKVDNMAAVREFHESFVANCQSSYEVGQNVTIDRILVPFRGRRQSIFGKYGIKFHALCDSISSYTHNLEIHCEDQKPADVVKRLIVPIENTNRNVTVGNHYCDYQLAEHLSQRGLTFLGALKKSNGEVPIAFVANRSRTVGTSIYGFQPDKTLSSYVPKRKRVLLLLSTAHSGTETEPKTGKPIIVIDYDRTKGGIVEKLCSSYSTAKKTKRWPLVVFLHELNIAGINSYKIYKRDNLETTMTRKDFLVELAKELMEINLRERATLLTLPLDVKLFLQRYKVDTPEQKPLSKRKYCYMCGSRKNNKTQITCCRCNRHICGKHSTRKVTCEQCNTISIDCD